MEPQARLTNTRSQRDILEVLSSKTFCVETDTKVDKLQLDIYVVSPDPALDSHLSP